MNILKYPTLESKCVDEESFRPPETEPNIPQPQIVAYIEFPSDCHIFDTKWIPTFPTKFIVAGATSNDCGAIQIYQLNNDQVDVEKIVEKKAAFRCASFNAIVRNTSVSLGNFHGNLQIFDVERFDFPIYDVKAHNGIVNCLDGIGGKYGSAEIVTGGQDGCIKIWDPRQGLAVVCISAVNEKDGGSGPRDCWSVYLADGLSQNDRVVCAGFDNGDVKVIDLRMMKERWGCNVESAVCTVNCDKKYEEANRLLAGTVDGNVHVFDMSKKQLDEKGANHINKRITDKAPRTAIWSVNHMPQSAEILAACNGGSVEIWRQ